MDKLKIFSNHIGLCSRENSERLSDSFGGDWTSFGSFLFRKFYLPFRTFFDY